MVELPKGAIPLTERETLAHAWDSFRKAAVPEDAGPDQYRAMRRTFYAGATAVFSVMLGNLDADPEMTQLDEAYVLSLMDECRDFARLVGTGRA